MDEIRRKLNERKEVIRERRNSVAAVERYTYESPHYDNYSTDSEAEIHPEAFRLPQIPERKPEFSLVAAAVGERPSTRALANDRKSVNIQNVFKKPVNDKAVIDFQED